MRIYTQISMLYAAAVYLMWGLGFMLAPADMHKILSAGPYDPAMTAMFTASLLAFAIIIIAFVNFLNRAFITVAIVVMSFLGVTTIYQIAHGNILSNLATITTLIINCGVALFLIYSLLMEAAGAEWKAAPRARSRRPSRSRVRAKAVARKKKQAPKKKGPKKKKTKRRR